MSKIKFHEIAEKEKTVIYNELGRTTGMAPYAVEKDWWVVQTLAIIFEMDIGQHLVFKGGTSLSKAWGLIERFSEDVDLAIDRSFLGFNGELKKKDRTNLRKATSTYISEIFYPALITKFMENGLTDVEFKIKEAKSSDQDPRIIEIYYPNVIKTSGYIQPRVQVEILRGAKILFLKKFFLGLLLEP